MAISVKNYTNRYVAVVILVVIAVWAILFYAFMMDEVYDNIDDGLKNQKIEIIREVYRDSDLLNTKEFGVNQFRILPTEARDEIDKNIFTKEFIFMPYDGEDEPYRVLRTGFYNADGTPFNLEIRTSTVEEDDYLINLAISLSVLYFVIVLSILIVNYFVLSKAWKPFNKILKNLNEYRFGETPHFIPINTNVKEFVELNTNFESMIARNERVFENQKRFLENASHELQTPLAITINKLELLLADEDLKEGQLEKIVEAKQSLHRMVSLNKSLLMLSRIDNDQYTGTSEVLFNDVVKKLLEELHELLEYKGVTVDIKEDGDFIASMNPNLAIIMVSNLLRNAMKYNDADGEIKIKVTKDTLSIANTSSFGALNPDYIFERFYKGKQDHQSNGLGLSIIQSILTKYTFLSISYAYEKNMHVFYIKK